MMHKTYSNMFQSPLVASISGMVSLQRLNDYMAGPFMITSMVSLQSGASTHNIEYEIKHIKIISK